MVLVLAARGPVLETTRDRRGRHIQGGPISVSPKRRLLITIDIVAVEAKPFARWIEKGSSYLIGRVARISSTPSLVTYRLDLVNEREGTAAVFSPEMLIRAYGPESLPPVLRIRDTDPAMNSVFENRSAR